MLSIYVIYKRFLGINTYFNQTLNPENVIRLKNITCFSYLYFITLRKKYSIKNLKNTYNLRNNRIQPLGLDYEIAIFIS